MTTYLNVPFKDRVDAKSKGARWDADAKKWFVPHGRDLEPFNSWLPIDIAKLASEALTAPNKGVPLSHLLAGVASVVEQAFRNGVWTTAELMKVDGDPHVYLELAERANDGRLIAKARGIVWSRDVDQVLGTFQAATGVRLAAGIKVMIRARPELSVQHGLALHIDAIDPSYTLGDLEARKRQIREQLVGEGIFHGNRRLPASWDYRTLLVVSPPRAAGLGDFARDADRLQRHRLLEASYSHSRFEGEGAPALVRQAIEEALQAWPSAQPPDAIVIIRGGGAVNDLAWLNDYELAKFICLSPIPVLTGIGHERDSTILDEVAHQSFDTPSKVIAGIQSLIVKRAREAQSAFDDVAGQVLRQLQAGRANIDRAHGDVRERARATLNLAEQGTTRILSDVRASATGRLATAKAKASSLEAQVKADAGELIREAHRSTDEMKTDTLERARSAIAGGRERSEELLAEVGRGARGAVRQGAAAAEASFREVVAQGPQTTLGRGFAVVRKPGGEIVSSAAAAGAKGALQVQFHDGSIDAVIKST